MHIEFFDQLLAVAVARPGCVASAVVISVVDGTAAVAVVSASAGGDTAVLV